MQRRTCLVAFAALVAPQSRATAQGSGRLHRIGILRPGKTPLSPTDAQAVGIPNALKELGYENGRNAVIESRFAGSDPKTLAQAARELVAARMDVIVAVGTSAVRAARDATSTTPIVMFGNFDPIALGLVTNLARPGGNITGILIAPDGTLAGKRLELLRAVAPGAGGPARYALLAPDDPPFEVQIAETIKAAARLKVDLSVIELQQGDYAKAFAAIAAVRPAGLLVGAHSFFVRDRKEIIERAARLQLPAMYEWREQVVDGGLMSYSTSLQGLHQRIAAQVDRILKGTRAGELPVEQPTRFEFVVNLKTARDLGLVLAPALRLQVDELIE